jgi:hypothetical protein
MISKLRHKKDQGTRHKKKKAQGFNFGYPDFIGSSEIQGLNLEPCTLILEP